MEETERHSKESICLPMFPGPLALGWGHVTSPGQWDVSRNDDVCHFTHEKCEKPMHKSPNSLPHTWWEATVYPGDAVPRWRSLHQPKALSDWVEESPWGPVWDMECEWEVNFHYIKTLRLKKKKSTAYSSLTDINLIVKMSFPFQVYLILLICCQEESLCWGS